MPLEAISPSWSTAGAPKVVVVVINWNDGPRTIACLDALGATDYPNYQIIVVDNASTDGSLDQIRARPEVEIVANTANLGYTGGVNIGIARACQADAEYVWLLNNDAVTQPDVLSRLVAAAEADPDIGLVSPIFYDPDDRRAPSFCLGRFDPQSRYATETADSGTARHWQETRPREVVLIGTALLIRRKLIDTIGTLDPVFFAYVEDVDYSLRAAAAGFRNVAVLDAIVFHKFKQPVERPDSVPHYLHYFITRNYLLLWRKLPRPLLFRKAMLWFLRQRLLQIMRMRAEPLAVEAVLLGLWDGLRGLGGAYRPERRPPGLMRYVIGKHPRIWLALIDRRHLFGSDVR